MGRLDRSQLRDAVAELDSIVAQVDHIEVTAALAEEAGEPAEAHGLRGYDAVHLAAASAVHEALVLVTGDSGSRCGSSGDGARRDRHAGLTLGFPCTLASSGDTRN